MKHFFLRSYINQNLVSQAQGVPEKN